MNYQLRSMVSHQIVFEGIVQGVGFRPTLMRIADSLDLIGRVRNATQGVLVDLNCDKETAEKFVKEVQLNLPSGAFVSSHRISKLSAFEYYTGFSIDESFAKDSINSPLTPDSVICDSCKHEISDKSNRRHGYAFTTCTTCGPRYAITSKFPFDRCRTSFETFEQCTSCSDEYNDINDNRFHSQSNSCSTCGPSLAYKSVAESFNDSDDEVIAKAVADLESGEIVLIKNMNGFLLCCDATNQTAVKRLRKKKNRPYKPFALLFSDIELVQEQFFISKEEEELLTSRQGPIVLIKPKSKVDYVHIAPMLNEIGVMLPSSALLQLVASQFGKPMVATSGNFTGSPILAENNEVDVLLEIATSAVVHNLDIQFPQDDSVVKVVDDAAIFYRRSRGYAPNMLHAKTSDDGIGVLAMGADLKSTFTFQPNKYIYTSQYIGNIENFKVQERYQLLTKKYFELFGSQPNTILVDKHPTYFSRALGEEYSIGYNAQFIEVQHHVAHFCSVLGEHDLFNSNKRIIGFIWDGTGYGDDQSIWGGETFLFENKSIKRVNHLDSFKWLSRNKMATEPRLSLLSLSFEGLEDEIQKKFDVNEFKNLQKLKNSTSLYTSSVGRLFDAVASLLNVCDLNTFEGQAAMHLEACIKEEYTFSELKDFLSKEDSFSPYAIISSLAECKQSGKPLSYLSASFHFTLAKEILNQSIKAGVQAIALSGGVFQNTTLIKMTKQLCSNAGITVYLNKELPPNDENISFGQFMYHTNKVAQCV